ncbi:hypothetical protein LZP97_25660 [Rhodococcus sp. DMF-1]|uniref:hypothetical protein n=1 Tax=Rhodococcus TaxID=1827 RepID=UPI0006615FD4|nr:MULTISPECIES: hypothetical protein [Rhodococcus]UIR36924.1 hypothetical protein LZP97_25660 [Rhodococcus sp. DMF-1]
MADFSDLLDAEILRERRRITGGPRRYQKAPGRCRRCHTPFRPKGTTIAEHPGTLVHAGRGYCSTHLAEAYLRETR